MSMILPSMFMYMFSLKKIMRNPTERDYIEIFHISPCIIPRHVALGVDRFMTWSFRTIFKPNRNILHAMNISTTWIELTQYEMTRL